MECRGSRRFLFGYRFAMLGLPALSMLWVACKRNERTGETASAINEAAFIRANLAGLHPPSELGYPIGDTARGPQAPSPYVVVTVYYGTSRAPSGRKDPDHYYGTARGALRVGLATITIPKRIRPGDLRGPRWYLLEFRPDPSRDVILRDVHPLELGNWTAQVRAALDTSPGRQALVVVHGFREQFKHALRRTAQLAYDLNFTGVPIAYSWPTKGTLQGYLADEATSEWAAPHLRRFLSIIAVNTGAQHIFVIAHSMGSRVLAGALAPNAGTHPVQTLEQVILAAPDVDSDVFEQRDVQFLRKSAKWITLYASSRDNALMVSRGLHAYRRAGLSDSPLVIVDSMDTIDASRVDTDLIGHGYFSENKAVIDDLFMLIRYGFSAERRNLLRQPQGPTWFYVLR